MHVRGAVRKLHNTSSCSAVSYGYVKSTARRKKQCQVATYVTLTCSSLSYFSSFSNIPFQRHLFLHSLIIPFFLDPLGVET
jgi:hypothetical protein